MAHVALFHSVLGARAGIVDAAGPLRRAGHAVRVVDQYDGLTFDDYDAAAAHAEAIGGLPALMAGAVAAVADLPDGFVGVGFSNGGGLAQHVALSRPVAGVVLCSGAVPLTMLGSETWPAVPVQIHYGERDPFRQPGCAEALVSAAQRSGAPAELFEYPVDGHLFTDPALPAEYHRPSAAKLWERVLDFCDRAVPAATATVHGRRHRGRL